MGEGEEQKAGIPGDAAGGSGALAKRLKISRMSLEVLDKEIEKTKKCMGGLHSRYGRALAGHRTQLLAMSPGTGRKAV